MKDIVILCNGAFPRKEYPLWLLDRADILVCCDGALATLMRHEGKSCHKYPDAVVGDFDSLSSALRRRFADILFHNPDQETNDLTKAMKFTIERYSGEDGCAIHILGASGKREDHSIGNISLLMEYGRMFGLAGRGITVEMVSDWSTAFAIEDSTSFDCGTGRAVSLFSNDRDLRIHADGLQWPLDEVVFDNWWKGTLNRSNKDTVTLTLSRPSPVLVILSD